MLVHVRDRPLIELIFKFFAAQEQDSDEFNRIVAIVAPRRERNFVLLAAKTFTMDDFLFWVSATSPQIFSELRRTKCEHIINRLVEIDVLIIAPSGANIFTGVQYFFNRFDGGIYKNINLLLSKFFGFPYIAKSYTKSVFKIVSYDAFGDQSIGTGFLIFHEGKSKILTNYHVIENPARTRIFTVDDKELFFDIVIKSDEKQDLALITLLEDQTDVPHFEFWIGIGILDEVLTIGYPPVASSRNSHPLYHVGEVNSEIEQYSDLALFLFSAKSNPGNSGSPVIGNDGRLLGIVTQILEHKGGILEGKLPYYAAIPSVAINRFLGQKTLVLKNGVVTVPNSEVGNYRHLTVNVVADEP